MEDGQRNSKDEKRHNGLSHSMLSLVGGEVSSSHEARGNKVNTAVYCVALDVVKEVN